LVQLYAIRGGGVSHPRFLGQRLCFLYTLEEGTQQVVRAGRLHRGLRAFEDRVSEILSVPLLGQGDLLYYQVMLLLQLVQQVLSNQMGVTHNKEHL
jgi:hypothetical protein